ncbi:Inositol-pentakisphosphate 2-kinase [Bertholletia excelsa]
MSDLARRRFSVGYALAQKKVQSFIQPSLVDYARERGVDLIPLDASKPLVDQGSFDCIIHKLYDQEWKKNLINFSSTYPYVPVIDHPDAIERLRDRTTMLQVVDELQLHSHDHSVSIPKQIVVEDWELFSDPNTITLQGLTFPLIAKPLIADGSANSHQMSLLFNSDGIKELKLKPPVVFQEFVNHGGVIFKVYVVGEYVQCVKRRSLPDVSAEKMGNSEGLLSFSQISNLAREDQDDCDHTSHIEEAKMPL